MTTEAVQDVNALLGRYQNELAKTSTRAIVAEALHAEARESLRHRDQEIARLREIVDQLEAAMRDGAGGCNVCEDGAGSDDEEQPAD